tara:strand:- start:212 stop:541 length:330 start_codon:yes stop_codon:yes gene_type:complete
MNRFDYPHSHNGSNSALTNIPQKDMYPELPRNANVGDKAQLANQNVRVFPDWYKPYGFNYQGEGWFAFFFLGTCVGGWSYMNDIKEMKGRKSRKVYLLDHDNVKSYKEN